MIVQRFTSAFMGGLMGLVMLWMVHGMITGETESAGAALLAFGLAHVAVAIIVVMLAIWATRFAPGLRARLDRLHRPSLRHAIMMLCNGAVTAFAAHLIMHGGI